MRSVKVLGVAGGLLIGIALLLLLLPIGRRPPTHIVNASWTTRCGVPVLSLNESLREATPQYADDGTPAGFAYDNLSPCRAAARRRATEAIVVGTVGVWTIAVASLVTRRRGSGSLLAVPS